MLTILLCFSLDKYFFSSAEELTNYARGSNVPISYMILEVLFSQLFRLPVPPQPTGFYGEFMVVWSRTVVGLCGSWWSFLKGKG